MRGVLRKCLPVFLHLVGELKEQLAAFVFPLEKGFKHYVPLRKITGKFSGITVGSGGRNAVFPVYEAGYGFVEGHILRGQIIVVVIVGIKIFQLDRKSVV